MSNFYISKMESDNATFDFQSQLHLKLQLFVLTKQTDYWFNSQSIQSVQKCQIAPSKKILLSLLLLMLF